MNKKGVAIVFDWMFSIVAGVLIFSFLIYFAVQNTDLFGKVTARVVSEELDILFSGYETTETRSVLDLGKKVELRFSCDDKNLKQEFTINDREGKTMWGKVIFAPKKIENDKINVATMSWDVPFRVANFVYLWDKKYVLTGDVPDVALFGNFEKSNNGNIKFVQDSSLSFSQKVGVCPDFGSQYKKIIYYDKGDDYKGYVCFQNDDGTKYRSFFYGEAMMIGAIFSEGYNDFQCVKNIAVNRLNIVNEVYSKKKSKMILLDTKCEVSEYSNAVHNPEQNSNQLREFDKFDFGYINRIEDANNRLISGGCAGVY